MQGQNCVRDTPHAVDARRMQAAKKPERSRLSINLEGDYACRAIDKQIGNVAAPYHAF
jgi:hypothetical protein